MPDAHFVTDLQAACAAQQALGKPAAVIYTKHLATLRRLCEATTGLALVRPGANGPSAASASATGTTPKATCCSSASAWAEKTN